MSDKTSVFFIIEEVNGVGSVAKFPIIKRGPASFGFRSSNKAGKNITTTVATTPQIVISKVNISIIL
jgi:hypothetical protein